MSKDKPDMDTAPVRLKVDRYPSSFFCIERTKSLDMPKDEPSLIKVIASLLMVIVKIFCSSFKVYLL